MVDNSRVINADLLRTISRTLFPKTMGEVIDWSDYMWIHFGRYSNALKNAVRYFLGDFIISAADNETIGGKERAEIYDEFIYDYKIFDLLGRVGDEYVQYGNSFTSIEPEMDRMFVCHKCKAMFVGERVDDLGFSDKAFKGTCPKCGKHGKLKHIDTLDRGGKLQVRFWNPRLICINYCPTTKHAEYYLRSSVTWQKAFRDNDKLFLLETPYEFLVALEENKRIKFKPEYFKHLKCPVVSTYEDLLGGWGLPLYMNEFEKVIQLQMLERYNEVIVADYTVPFRVLAPPPSAGMQPNGDPLMTYNLGDFRSKMMEMIRIHRKNPSDIQIAPFAVQYQILGGEAKQLIPYELIKATIDDLLSSMCVPIEFSEMSMANTGGPPIGLRRFEKVWGAHVSALDEWLQWFCDVRTDLLRKQKVVCRLVKSSIYEDDMSREYKVKLAMGGEISKDTGLRALGIDYAVEQLKLMDEANRQLELDQKNQEEIGKADELKAAMTTPQPGLTELQNMEMAAQGGAPAQGGMPPGGGMAPPAAGGAAGASGGSADLEALWAEAEQTAEQIRTAPPEQRRSMLINLSKTNPPLHAFVKKIIETTEQQAAQQGVAASRQGQM